MNKNLHEACAENSSDSVAPCAKRDEQLSVFTDNHITVHHGAEADGNDGPEHTTVLFKNILADFPIAILQASPNIFKAVCPNAVLV